MAHDRSKQGPSDSFRINVNEYYEVDYWTDTLRETKDGLIKAVDQVGNSVKAVREHLEGK